MKASNRNKHLVILLVAAAFITAATPAYAYIGPAVAFLGYLLGPVAAVVIVIALTLFLPLKALYKKIKKKKDDSSGKEEQ